MTDFSSPGGWKDRTKRNREKIAARDAAADIRAERARMYAGQAAEGLKSAAEHDERNRQHKCYCPACDGEGLVTAEQAERVYRAFERLPSDSKPNSEVIANLVRAALGQPVHGPTPRMVAGVYHPRKVEKTDDSTKFELPAKGKKSIKINALTHDGALIDLDD